MAVDDIGRCSPGYTVPFPNRNIADDPIGNLVIGSDGALYGSTYEVPAVFRVAPPIEAGGAWKTSMIAQLPFQSIGTGGIAQDRQGNIYVADAAVTHAMLDSGLEDRLADLHSRVHGGTYRAKESRLLLSRLQAFHFGRNSCFGEDRDPEPYRRIARRLCRRASSDGSADPDDRSSGGTKAGPSYTGA